MDYFNDMIRFVPLEAKSVLDVGAGWGLAGILLRHQKWLGHDIETIEAIEGWEPLYRAMPSAYHKKFYGDIEDVLIAMVSEGKHYDTVICTHVLEHFDQDKADRVMKLMEQIATMRVILAAPNRFHENDIEKCGNNPLQQHKILFDSRMAKQCGYHVRGTGRMFSLGVGFVKRTFHRYFSDWIGYKDMNRSERTEPHA